MCGPAVDFYFSGFFYLALCVLCMSVLQTDLQAYPMFYQFSMLDYSL